MDLRKFLEENWAQITEFVVKIYEYIKGIILDAE
jgi:hypothetical protein